ncbi:MAG: DUF465 domain-containing protein [Limibacillus sp.]|jgi:uncharacterized protein YdcH (DUF465 family)
MSHPPDKLEDEFPELCRRIHDLEARNGHFERMNREYCRVNRKIHHIEVHQNNLEDEVPDYLKRKRLALKDELLVMLQGV